MKWKDAKSIQEAAMQALALAAAGGFVVGFVLWNAGAGLRAALLLALIPIGRFLWATGRLGGGR